ncbi:MAG: hypothetical protein AAGC63_15870 [Propionicimonas sp.]|nr:hypothetical protein [Propionicimonas sp.]
MDDFSAGAGRPPRHRARRLGAVALVAAAAMGLAASPAAADDGLFESSRTRYEVDVEQGMVEVTSTVTIRNTLPDRGSRYFYFDGYQIAVPASAERIRARSGGAALTVTLRPGVGDETYRYALARFPQLRYGRSRTITYTYELPGAPIRSADPTRAGKGYAAFAVQGPGEPGEASVEVLVPDGVEFTSSAGSFTSKAAGGTTTWRAEPNEDGEGFWSFVSVRDPGKVGRHTTTTVAGQELQVLSFPDDEKWAGFVSETFAAGVPALEAAIGVPWPGGVTRVREDVSPAVTGYAWFDHAKDEIVLGEDLDTALLLHEASHAWFNSGHFSERWLREGLADLVAYRLDGRIGEDAKPPKAPRRDSKAAVALADWEEPSGRVADASERYGYAASYTAMQRLLGDLDDAELAGLVAAAYIGQSAYDNPDAHVPGYSITGWRQFLDLVEDRTGNGQAAATFSTWVIPDGLLESLDDRAAARETYRALDARDAAWQPPRGLRRAMTNWQFSRAATVMERLSDTAAAAGRLQEAAAAAGLTEPETVRRAYSQADTDSEYSALATLIPRAVEVVGAVTEASRTAGADADPFTRLGELILGVDAGAEAARARFSEGELETAAGLAAGVIEQSRWTRWLGLGAVTAAVLALGGAVAGVAALRARRRRSAQDVRLGQLDQPDVAAHGLGTDPQVVLAGFWPPGPDEVGIQPPGESGDIGPDRDTGGHSDRDGPGGRGGADVADPDPAQVDAPAGGVGDDLGVGLVDLDVAGGGLQRHGPAGVSEDDIA